MGKQDLLGELGNGLKRRPARTIIFHALEIGVSIFTSCPLREHSLDNPMLTVSVTPLNLVQSKSNFTMSNPDPQRSFGDQFLGPRVSRPRRADLRLQGARHDALVLVTLVPPAVIMKLRRKSNCSTNRR